MFGVVLKIVSKTAFDNEWMKSNNLLKARAIMT